MDDNIQKALWLGVGILLFIAVVAIGLSIFAKGKGLAMEASEQLDEKTRELNMAAYGSYNGQLISGTDTLNAIREFKAKAGDIQVVIKVNGGNSIQYISTGVASTGVLTARSTAEMDIMLKAAQNKNSTGTYINPYGSFYSTLIEDTNGVVRGMQIIQEP